MNKNDLLNYMIDFAVENNWDYDNVPEQIRSFFTTWCFVFRIDASSKECEESLSTLFWRADLYEQFEYDEFTKFMLKLIV